MTTPPPVKIDVLCVGHACYDLVFSVAKHPESDEKVFADNLVGCGGGPAANAAVAVSRLGFKAAFAGYLGQDLYGEMHQQELIEHHVNTRLVVRDSSPTPLSTVLVKPDGKRALINYKGSTKPLSADAIDFFSVKAKVILFDGHEPHLSQSVVEFAHDNAIPSEKFARQFAGNVTTALTRLSERSPAVVITLGDKGLIWQRGKQSGSLAAFPVKAVDTTGAGDAFHGAFTAALAADMEWLDILRYSSAAGALCCTKVGARQGLPFKESVESYFSNK